MKRIENNIYMSDFYKGINISGDLEDKWQEILDLAASIIKVPSSLIIRAKTPCMEVFKTDNLQANPYKIGDQDKVLSHYSETIIKTQKELLLPNVQKTEDSEAAPGFKSGLISLFGYPINFPDQSPFGTICIMDTKERSYTENDKKLLLQFKNVIELDLKIYIEAQHQQKDIRQSYEKKISDIGKLSEAVNQSDNVIVVTDTKGRVSADQQLIESEAVFRHITENNSYGIGIVQDAKFVYGNEKLYKIYDLTPGELIGKGLKEILSNATVTALKEEFNSESKSGITNIREMDICTLKGKKLVISVHRSEINYEGKKAYLSIHEDITERKNTEEKLRKSEEKLSKHFEDTPIGVIEWNIDFEVISWNKAAKDIFGYSKEETIGRNAIGLILPKEGSKEVKLIWNSLLNQSGGTRSINENITKEGKTILCDWHNTTLLNEQGKTVGVASLIQDITEQKQIEGELRKSEERLKIISVISSDYVYSIQMAEDGKSNIKWVNGAFERITGYTKEEINKKENGWDSIIHPEDLSRLKLEQGNLSALKISSTDEYRIIIKNGDSKWLSDSYVKFDDPEDKKSHFIHGSVRDITDQKIAELNLIDSEEKFRSLFENSNDAIMIMKNDRFISCNSETLKLTKLPKTEIIGKTPFDFSPEYQPDGRLSSSIASEKINTASTGEKVNFEFRHLLPDGTYFDADVALNQFTIKNEKFLQVILRDITERKKAGQALIESEEKFSKIFDLNPGIVIIIEESEQTIVEVNQGIIDTLGYSREELIGKTTIEVGLWAGTNVSDREKFYDDYNKNIGFAHLVTNFKKKNGQIIICDISAKRIEIKGRNHLFAIGSDITETKKAEAQIKEHNQEMITLNKQMAEYKMMALRSAMNPHFVFNCLNSIQYFIAGNDKRSAISYLSLFSKLIRNVLNSSVNQYTTLEKEVETLKYYIELEKLRFDDKFSFELSLDEDLDTDEIEIPSLIIQPYIENAIIHGLTSKDGHGKLLLEITNLEDKLLCVIEDDGIGRQKSESFNLNKKLAHKSVGMTVTEERLNIINKTNDVSINIIDLEEDGLATGTRVEILITIDKR